MKFRTIKIWLSKGWYYAVYSVSLLLVTIITSCSSSKAVAKEKADDKEPVDSTKNGVSVINMEDFQGLGIETPDIRLMYGVPRPIQELR